ncbi:hypothetical protein PR048_011106 [Dryococelus australis]|uniref:Reverse transcriptase/retrotransposon-derived protein RNase H-like domain-containing protein n=1 Tax=Dryococelus australis TaxID=614101 RepID=A0ABQ9HKM3_9NEOP|nr:hypothetical protein PR048_011106 [Dryococelus australis]
MLQLGVLEFVTEPVECLNQIAIVRKINEDFRWLCLDPQLLNELIHRQYHRMPTFEEVSADLEDVSRGFWQIQLNEESSKLTTFDTPTHGRILSYGLACAPEIFHSTFSGLFNDVPRVLVYMEDIIVYGKCLQDRNETPAKSIGPLAYVSKTLGPAQHNYAQIEKDLITYTPGKELVIADALSWAGL